MSQVIQCQFCQSKIYIFCCFKPRANIPLLGICDKCLPATSNVDIIQCKNCNVTINRQIIELKQFLKREEELANKKYNTFKNQPRYSLPNLNHNNQTRTSGNFPNFFKNTQEQRMNSPKHNLFQNPQENSFNFYQSNDERLQKSLFKRISQVESVPAHSSARMNYERNKVSPEMIMTSSNLHNEEEFSETTTYRDLHI